MVRDRDASIEVTVVGGYLGAGKTTLVNHLLAQAADGAVGERQRIAVLVNDFGNVNVDRDLIVRRSDDTIELSNGCICCSIVDGFAETLDRIVGLDPRPDRLVIETSGVADPAGVAAYCHTPALTLDAVIVLADAATIRDDLDDTYVGQTVRQQLDAAEVLVLNKVDLVEASAVDEMLQWLEVACPDALVITTTQSRVEPEVLFGRRSTRAFAASGFDHHAERVFATRTIEAGVVDRDWISDVMASLPPDRTVRAKGLVDLGEATPFVLQRVGKRWRLRPAPQPWPGDPATRIVIIERRSD